MSQHVSAVAPGVFSGATALAVDSHLALIPEGRRDRQVMSEGPLADLTFVAKDLFDLKGEPTGGGVPALRDSSVSALQDAQSVRLLLRAGATLVGRSKCDALAYGLAGTNSDDDAPLNPLWLNRVPGGSSSGSAVAVASGFADLGLATDTGGSIRIPAAYCGVYGWRPTFGLVDSFGMLALARDFDTTGLLASTPAHLARGAQVLAPLFDSIGLTVKDICLVDETLDTCDDDIAAAVIKAHTHFANHLDISATRDSFDLNLEAMRAAFQHLQSFQAWQQHGAWIDANAGVLPEVVEKRFRAGEKVNTRQRVNAFITREGAFAALQRMYTKHSVLMLPAAPTLPPRLDTAEVEMQSIRMRSLEVTSVPGLVGLPCVVVPIDTTGRPVPSVGAKGSLPLTGVCLVGLRNTDHALLALASAWVARSQLNSSGSEET